MLEMSSIIVVECGSLRPRRKHQLQSEKKIDFCLILAAVQVHAYHVKVTPVLIKVCNATNSKNNFYLATCVNDVISFEFGGM